MIKNILQGKKCSFLPISYLEHGRHKAHALLFQLDTVVGHILYMELVDRLEYELERARVSQLDMVV